MRPIEEGELVDWKPSALEAKTMAPEDAAFREWLCSGPEDRRSSVAGSGEGLDTPSFNPCLQSSSNPHQGLPQAPTVTSTNVNQ